MPYQITQPGPDELDLMHALLSCFAAAFDDPDTYSGNRPSDSYLRTLLASSTFIPRVAHEGQVLVPDSLERRAFVLPSNGALR